MALKGKVSTTLNHTSIIDGELVINMYANIPETGETTRNMTISNKNLYDANKAECRADMEAFDSMVNALEDNMHSGGTGNEAEK